MLKCEICNKEFKIISHMHLKRHNVTLGEYKLKFPLAKINSDEYTELLSKVQKGKKIGEKNPSKRKEVRDRISATVKKRWVEGNYKDRVNGMSLLIGKLSPKWKAEKREPLFFAENEYVSFLSRYQNVKKCSRCGFEKSKINVHHVDENHSNFLPSNLEPLCVPCHSSFHYRSQKQPFIFIGRKMSFAAAHFLPDYDGKCSNVHGHEWFVEVVIRKRVDKKTGMVMDFVDLKKAIQEVIINPLDHSFLNEKIGNPTAENILVWCWERLMFDSLLKGIQKINLWESPGSYSSLDVDGMLSIFSHNIERYVKR